MKKAAILFCIILFSIAQRANATDWNGYYYEFHHFKYRAFQLLGSEAEAPDMYPVAVRMNQYVASLQQSGKLKDKPVVYDIYTTVELASEERRGEKRYLLELYETDDAYHIHANYRENFMFTFSQEELALIIDYFAGGAFEPFFCDTTMNRRDLAKELLFNKINAVVPATGFEPSDAYEIYKIDDWSIKMEEKFLYVYFKGEKLNVKLNYPLSRPIAFKERMILINNDYFSVFENGACMKMFPVSGLMWDMEEESNSHPQVVIYPEWMNIMQDGEIRGSYSYRENKFYDLN